MKEFHDVTQYFHTPSKDFLNASLYITWAGHRQCEAGFSAGPRLLDTYNMVFVLSGQGYLKVGNQDIQTLRPGDMFIIHPQEWHHYYADSTDPWEVMWISFKGSLSELLLSEAGLTHEQFILNNVMTHSIQRTVQTIINALGDTADTHRLCATGQLYILFAYLKQNIETTPPHSVEQTQNVRVWKAIRFIEQNYYLDIDVAMLSEYVNYSRSYLSRVFKAETNMTIPEYINNIRIQNAVGLLKNSQMPIKEIATSVGITDSFYFSKLFKKVTGETPREWRKNHG